ncbi:hypothetical protein [Gemmatimonas sp.]|uniref:hypothetical protein n=1 Tax=Gemmatimonas sp. TaxID=1962908 RepID=UPI0025B937F3|nr:hypothetical protein [Gemmatimonas sp.]MCA2986391.1 hypothetical protein [Gemmatimonas sp.]MCA2990770.1 hypothetical protein [Gemmatimonas sp.]
MPERARSVSIRRLHDQPDAGLSGATTPASRLALVETLTHEAFALAGTTAIVYPRHEAPVVVRALRPGPFDTAR